MKNTRNIMIIWSIIIFIFMITSTILAYAGNGDIYYFTNTPIEIENTQLILFLQIIFLFFFIVIAEKYKDVFYFMISAILSLTTGYTLLFIVGLPPLVSIIIICLAIYLTYMMVITSMDIRKKFKEKES